MDERLGVVDCVATEMIQRQIILTEGKESEERGNATNKLLIRSDGNGEQWNYPFRRNENPN